MHFFCQISKNLVTICDTLSGNPTKDRIHIAAAAAKGITEHFHVTVFSPSFYSFCLILSEEKRQGLIKTAAKTKRNHFILFVRGNIVFFTLCLCCVYHYIKYVPL